MITCASTQVRGHISATYALRPLHREATSISTCAITSESEPFNASSPFRGFLSEILDQRFYLSFKSTLRALRKSCKTNIKLWVQQLLLGVCEYPIGDFEYNIKMNEEKKNISQIFNTSFGQKNTVLHMLRSLLALHNKTITSCQ